VPAWLERLVPEAFEGTVERLSSPEILIALAVLSAVTFVASLIGVPFFLSRLPQDYFSRREREELGIPAQPKPLWRVGLYVLQNALGVLLLVLGLLMLVLPGQGLLTLLVGLLLVDFPGKRKIERWLIARPSVLRTINSLRRRAGREPLEPRASWLPPEPSERTETES
jgi:hypothetical protein